MDDFVLWRYTHTTIGWLSVKLCIMAWAAILNTKFTRPIVQKKNYALPLYSAMNSFGKKYYQFCVHIERAAGAINMQKRIIAFWFWIENAHFCWPKEKHVEFCRFFFMRIYYKMSHQQSSSRFFVVAEETSHGCWIRNTCNLTMNKDA